MGRCLANTYAWIWGRCKLRWFDHRFDFLRGPGFWYWQERGILGRQSIAEGGMVLDLCCGDGLYDSVYFGDRAGTLHAVDREPEAIRTARKFYKKSNVEYFVNDVVRDPFPSTGYDTILCFSALQQIEREALRGLLLKIHQALNAGGVFFGSISVLSSSERFKNEYDVRLPLEHCFPSVKLFASKWPSGRTEWYFECRKKSD